VIGSPRRDRGCDYSRGRKVTSSGNDISALYREFKNALTEVLAENAVGPGTPFSH
jgi:hypothetical protein